MVQFQIVISKFLPKANLVLPQPPIHPGILSTGLKLMRIFQCVMMRCRLCEIQALVKLAA